MTDPMPRLLLLAPVALALPALAWAGVLGSVAGIGLTSTALAAWIYLGAGRLLTPRRHLAQQARQLAPGGPQGGDDWAQIEASLHALAHQREQDRARIRELEMRLHRAQVAAESADSAKRAFLANIGHEIRTPMNVVVGMTRLALKLAADPRQREHLLRADRAAHGLLTQISNLLDVVKLESGELHLERTAFAVEELLSQLVATYAEQAERKGLDLRCEQDPRMPPVLVGDMERLRQVLASLTDNALKFTEAGEIVIACRPIGRDARHARIGFEVRDTGAGIPVDQQAELFGLFRQGDTSLTRRHGGSGLGLGLCYRLVQAMGGVLKLDSRQDLGSSFQFELDFAVPTASSQAADATLYDSPHVRPPAAVAVHADAHTRSALPPAPVGGTTRIRVRGNDRLLRRLMGRFRLEHGDFVADWSSLHSAGDRFGAAQLAQALESAAASLGALELRAAAARLARQRRADDTTEAAVSRVAMLLQMLLAEIDQRLGDDPTAAAAGALSTASHADPSKADPAANTAAPEPPVSLDAALRRLAALLADFDAAAINAHEQVHARLSGLVCAETLATLRNAVNGFDFATAAELIEEVAEALGVALEQPQQ
ncbi:ATP-binding protein [uncultured Thiohalocapsa sp.]|uniref:sensor histidine kinase n=1 Tax=uncultured Thiohalocapsa sp. TaxID=768990 RepID=UPI0025CC6A88|nr:ATP-binding protein [uncultured Thiohalocapsa sp.]